MHQHGWIVDVLIDIAKYCDKNNLPSLQSEIFAMLKSTVPTEIHSGEHDSSRHALYGDDVVDMKRHTRPC